MTDSRAAMAALLASTQAQEQAAEVLREAGWTVHAPGEVVWVAVDTETICLDDSKYAALVADQIVACVDRDPCCSEMAWSAFVFRDALGALQIGTYLETDAEARAAVEAALKGDAK